MGEGWCLWVIYQLAEVVSEMIVKEAVYENADLHGLYPQGSPYCVARRTKPLG